MHKKRRKQIDPGRTASSERHKIDGVKLKTSSVPFSVQQALGNLAFAKWPVGKFEESFPELADATARQREMKLSELAEELARRENDAEQVLKIADIELKSGTIGLWSGGVLTAIQLYFLLNLSAFSKRIQKGDEALDFPWIVLYRTRISFTFAALTLCIGPALLGGFFLPRLALANCEDHVFYCGFIEMGFAIVNLVIASVTMVKLWANFKPFPTQKR